MANRAAAPPLLRVALVGRTNVGKSTLFNRLTDRRNALVSPLPGTTRDRRDGLVAWRSTTFTLTDTGGVEEPARPTRRSRRTAGDLPERITRQTERAVAEADVILLVVSADDGLLPQDRRWAARLRGGKPTIVVINKVDSERHAGAVADFYQLGLGEPQPVSAASGRRSGDLLDRIVTTLHRRRPRVVTPTPDDGERPLAVAVLGQPNSGKSTLVNALLGEERVITSPEAHTTREPQDIPLTFRGRPLVIIDTAGIRRRAHVTAGVERQGVAASLRTVERADVVLLVVDVTRGPSNQDQRLARHVVDHGKGLVLVANKWDIVEGKTPTTMAAAERQLRHLLPGLGWVPIVFASALTTQRVENVLDAALRATAAAGVTLPEETLQSFLKTVTAKHRPTKAGGIRHPRLLSLKQVQAQPPRFEVVARGELHPAYLKFLENRLREHFGFTGIPVSVTLKARRKQPKR